MGWHYGMVVSSVTPKPGMDMLTGELFDAALHEHARITANNIDEQIREMDRDTGDEWEAVSHSVTWVGHRMVTTVLMRTRETPKNSGG